MKIKNAILSLLILTGSLFFSSCKNEKEQTDKESKTITERIQYDVIIKSPDPELDWYNQNLEGIKREEFVKSIINAATEGKVKVYDYFHTLLTPEELKKSFSKTDTVSVQDLKNPNISRDTIIKNELNLQEITKVRFLEEWKMNPDNLNFTKRVLGIMLMKENYGDSLELRGYTPLFWVYFDDKYPEALKVK